jgi:crossover junction endodeoxyribonuclease RusA
MTQNEPLPGPLPHAGAADIVRNRTDLPWDFVVLGVPKSVQARASSIQRWKEQVRAAAWEFWPPGEVPLDHKVQIHVTYYHDSAPLDVDNMLKPIQDALTGLVYVDDSQLVDTHGHLRDLNGQYRVRGLTPAQARGFTSGDPFVHIRIEMPSPVGELP